MGLILCLDTSSKVCSVALGLQDKILACRESVEENSHSALLTTLVSEVIHEAGIQLSALDAVAVSMGPGSYTGLRIGVASAKGLCYSLGKPLIAVSTLKAMALGIRELWHSLNTGENSSEKSAGSSSPVLYCPMLDARRMEVYSAVFNEDLVIIRPVSAVIVDKESFQDLLSEHRMVFGGEGAEKCKTVLGTVLNTVFLEKFRVSARFMVPLAREKFHLDKFENLAYFEPYYLKDFVAGKTKVKGLGIGD